MTPAPSDERRRPARFGQRRLAVLCGSVLALALGAWIVARDPSGGDRPPAQGPRSLAARPLDPRPGGGRVEVPSPEPSPARTPISSAAPSADKDPSLDGAPEPSAPALLELVDPDGRAVRAPARVEWADAAHGNRPGPIPRSHSEDGLLELHGLPRGETRLVLRTAGHAVRVVNVIAGPTPVRRRVELAREASLEISVRGRAGHALAGARARVQGLLGEGSAVPYTLVELARATTDGSGRAVLRGLDPSAHATLEVQAEGFRPARKTLGPAILGGGPLLLELEPAGVLEVQLEDGERRPVRAVLRLVDLSRTRIDGRTEAGLLALGGTDQGGRARFEDLPLGVPIGIRVQAAAPTSAEIWTVRTLEPLEANGERRVVIRLEDALRVRGTLRVAGRPAAGRVFFRHRVEGLRHDGSTIVVADDGQLDIWLPSGDYEVWASSAGFDERRSLALRAPTALEFDLGPGRRLGGILVDAHGAALPGRRLCASLGDGTTLAGVRSGADGSFLFPALPEGPLQLEVEGDADVPLRLATDTLAQDLGCVVLDERTVRVRVLELASGRPLAAALEVVPAGRRAAGSGPGSASAADGRVELRLPPGDWELRPRAQDWRGVPTALRIDGSATEVSIEVAAAAELRHDWPRPVPAQGPGTLTASAEGPAASWTRTFELSAGPRSMLRLPAGRVRLDFRGAQGERWSDIVHVPAPR